jgi:integrase
MVLKSMTKMALDLGVIEEDVCIRVKLFKLNNARTKFLNVFEVKRLINTCREYSNKTIAGYIALLALTGLRCGEVSNIKLKDVDIKKRVIHIPMTKNGKPRSIHLTDLMLGFIGRIPLKQGNPYLFAGKVIRINRTSKTLLISNTAKNRFAYLYNGRYCVFLGNY